MSGEKTARVDVATLVAWVGVARTVYVQLLLCCGRITEIPTESSARRPYVVSTEANICRYHENTVNSKNIWSCLCFAGLLSIVSGVSMHLGRKWVVTANQSVH